MWLRDATNEPQPPRTSELEGQELGRWVAERIRRSAKKLITQGEAIEPTTEAEQLHDLRKRAKTLRYMVECFASLLVDDARKSFVKRLKALQDNLGEIQDAAVHAEELQRTLERLGKDGVQKTTLAAGRLLTDSLDARQRSARAAFDDEFNAFNSRPTKRLLDEALSELES